MSVTEIGKKYDVGAEYASGTNNSKNESVKVMAQAVRLKHYMKEKYNVDVVLTRGNDLPLELAEKALYFNNHNALMNGDESDKKKVSGKKTEPWMLKYRKLSLSKKPGFVWRTNKINKLNAKAFISLHVNAHGNEKTKGHEVLYRNSKTSKALAKDICDSIKSTQNRGAKYANMTILRNSKKIPGCIVESGFLSHARTRYKMFSSKCEKHQNEKVKEIATGIAINLGLKEKEVAKEDKFLARNKLFGKKGIIKHTLKKGETLYGIAKKYDLSAKEIMKYNKIKDPRKIKIGRKILIPVNSNINNIDGVHVVEKGQTLSGIAKKYGVTVDQIMDKNKEIDNKNQINLGQKISIPINLLAIHEIKTGDNLTKISKKYNVDIDDIAELNEIENIGNIIIGNKLLIPR